MYTTTDYSNAPSGVGPLADVWRDKPHHLVYDLCAWVTNLMGEIDRLDTLLEMSAEEHEEGYRRG